MGHHIKLFVNKYDFVSTVMTRPQHSDEVTCGGYCIMVITLITMGHVFRDVCRVFDVLPRDDLIVRAFMQEYYNFSIKMVN